MNSYELYDAAEDLMKKWHKRWMFCLKIGLVMILSGIILGCFLDRPTGIIAFFGFLWIGFSACFFVSPKNREHELRRQAIAQWGKNEEEYW